jgi:hypothetical protein
MWAVYDGYVCVEPYLMHFRHIISLDYGFPDKIFFFGIFLYNTWLIQSILFIEPNVTKLQSYCICWRMKIKMMNTAKSCHHQIFSSPILMQVIIWITLKDHNSAQNVLKWQLILLLLRHVPTIFGHFHGSSIWDHCFVFNFAHFTLPV